MSRIATVSLTAIALFASGAAFAQDAAPAAVPAPAAAAPAQAPAAPATPAAPMAGMAMPAPAAAAPATTTAPATAAPAPAAAPVAPTAAAAPALPTDGIGARVLQVLDTVCMPMIRAPGSDQKQFAKTAGLKKAREDNTWSMKLEGVNKLNVRMPNAGNLSSCDLTLNYDVGQGPAVIAALTAWGATQPVALQKDKDAAPYVIDNINYATTNWTGFSATTRTGLAFTEQKKADGSPVAKGADQATVSLSFRGLSDQDRTAN